VYAATGIRQNLLAVAPGYTNAVGNGIGTDFPAFYAAAVEAHAGRVVSIYDMERLRDAHRAVRGVDVRPYSWAYPPTFLLLLLPLAWLSLVPALWTWLSATTGALLVGSWWIAPSPLTPIVVALFPGVTTSLVTGPTGMFSAAVVAAGLALLGRHGGIAGGVLGLLGTKPHLAALVPVCLLAGREWRALWGFVATSTGLAVASLLAFGAEPWVAFVASLPRHMAILAAGEVPWVRMPTVFVAVRHATGNLVLAWAAQTVATAAVLVASAFVWWRTTDPRWRALALAASLPLVGPYAYDYDTCALIVPILYVAHAALRRSEVSRRDAVLLVVLWLTPVALWLASTALGQQVGPLLLGMALAEAVRRARSAQR
jgi:hypothetical protein